MKFLPTQAARAAAAALLALATLSSGPAQAAEDRVVVLTSYPEEVSVRFQATFERLHPGKRVEILWRMPADALAYVRRGGAAEADVLWLPSPGTFAALRREGRFARLDLDRRALPGAIAGQPISDPDGYYAAFEIAGQGIAYNAAAVARLGLPAPRDWSDLAAPAYFGQVQMPAPGPSGFAHVITEAMLQGYGWTQGWAVLAGIAANADFGAAGTRNADATPDVDAIASGRRAARLTITMFAPRPLPGGAPLPFVYPRHTAYNPAQIAIFADAKHPQTARDFVNFALSAVGQELLTHPDIRRLPVRRDYYEQHPELPVQPFAPGNLSYSDALTRARQGLVATLFDVALVKRHAELAEVWQALRAAEAAGRGNEPGVQQARALLTVAPIDEATQADSALRQLFAFPERVPLPDAARRGAGANQPAAAPTPPPEDPLKAATRARWEARIDARLNAARAALGMHP